MKTNSTTNPTQSQQAWASTVSDYILQRRQQTTLAYITPERRDSLLSKKSKLENSIYADPQLFKALFIILAKQLEEGHTVLQVSASNDNEESIRYLNESRVRGTGYYRLPLWQWQQQLIQQLGVPLFDLLDTQNITAIESNNISESIADSISIEESDGQLSTIFRNQLDTILTQGAKIWQSLTLTHSERQLLSERHKLVIHLFDTFVTFNALARHPSDAQALEAFINQVKINPLMSAMTVNVGNNNEDNNKGLKNSLNNNSNLNLAQQQTNPIIYNITKSNLDKKSPTSITFWLHRTWQAEHTLAKRISNILEYEIEPLPIVIPDTLNEKQVKAIEIANNNAFSIITGGPGTGKTYTVAQLVIALHQAQDKTDIDNQPIKFSADSASLTLAAPTGKAAQRMQESLQAALDDANVDMQLEEAKTIHRLLGIGRNGKPRYNADNPLGEDVIIIDEASMLGVELANYLVSSVKPGARLILLGDANQLAAVDAGAVLADLGRIESLQRIQVTLTDSRRFNKDSGIGQLASEINKEAVDIKKIWQLLATDKALTFQSVATSQQTGQQENKDNSNLSNQVLLSQISTGYQPYINKLKMLQQQPKAHTTPDQVNELIRELNTFRVLTAGHHGKWGDNAINEYLTQWHISELKLPIGRSPWFHGRPVMILHNSYELGLFNGDIGICLQVAGSNKLEVFFENKTQGIAVNLLNDDLITTAYAMTIHKSQGSEFDHVTVTFDSAHSRLLSKELIYTAVTRAKKQVTIYSTKFALEQAVSTPTLRQTGLALQFTQEVN